MEISVELFMFILSAISVITGLVVEAFKVFYKTDCYNLLAGIVAIALTAITSVFYALWYPVIIDCKYIIFFICLAFASWLSAMLGFDKIKQALLQIGGK